MESDAPELLIEDCSYEGTWKFHITKL